MLAGAHPAFDGPVILFQNIVEVLHGSVLAIVGEIACGLESGNGGRMEVLHFTVLPSFRLRVPV